MHATIPASQQGRTRSAGSAERGDLCIEAAEAMALLVQSLEAQYDADESQI